MKGPVEAQQASTLKANVSKLKNRLQKTKCPLASSSRSPRKNLEMEKQKQAIGQQSAMDLEEEKQEEMCLHIKKRR
jgi:hypothetical protein